jgi:hypothetical protein
MSYRNSFYDGAAADDVIIDSSVAQAELAATNAEASNTSAIAQATAAAASAASALASQTAVNNIIPTGGDSEMILVKSSGDDHDLKWTNTLDNTTIDANLNGGYF